MVGPQDTASTHLQRLSQVVMRASAPSRMTRFRIPRLLSLQDSPDTCVSYRMRWRWLAIPLGERQSQ